MDSRTTRKFRQVLLNLIQQLPAGKIVGVEVGAATGAMGVVLLKELPDLHFYMIDAWKEFPEDCAYRKSGDKRSRLSEAAHLERKRLAVESTEFASDRRTIIHALSADAISQVPPNIDFVFIDASHAYDDVKLDLELWWPVLRPGGLFSGHNYGEHPGWGVKEAVDEFMAAKQLKFEFEESSVWWHWKAAHSA